MDITQEQFDGLLNWLDPAPQTAAETYQNFHQRLVYIFVRWKCLDAEELADETINRVARKVPEIRDTYTGDKFHYFHAVAKWVYRERRNKIIDPLPPVIPAPASKSEEDEDEKDYACLERCMGLQSPVNRELIIEYMTDEKRAKIDRRIELAKRLGITQNALRIRAHRVCAKLKTCVFECMETV